MFTVMLMRFLCRDGLRTVFGNRVDTGRENVFTIVKNHVKRLSISVKKIACFIVHYNKAR